MNEAAATLLAARLPHGLLHPGDGNDQPAKQVAMPWLSNHGLSDGQAAHFAQQAGLPSNDAPLVYATAIVHTLETEGLEIVARAELEELRARVATPVEANPAAPDVEVLCQHTRTVLFHIATGRHQVLMDCDAIKKCIDAVHGGA